VPPGFRSQLAQIFHDLADKLHRALYAPLTGPGRITPVANHRNFRIGATAVVTVDIGIPARRLNRFK
jgi:hypothetical protein